MGQIFQEALEMAGSAMVEPNMYRGAFQPRYQGRLYADPAPQERPMPPAYQRAEVNESLAPYLDVRKPLGD